MFKLNTPLRPGIPRGAYPERQEPRDRWLERIYGRGVRAYRQAMSRPARFKHFVQEVGARGRALERMGQDEILREAEELRRQLRISGFQAGPVARAFALVREVAGRAIGERHYDVQLIGGWILLQGMVAEMETGEGKTLTATLAASTAALAGVPVHVITVNDYLAKRDSEWVGPIYQALGLQVGKIIHGMDPDKKRAAYACDVTYCTNKEIAFDYLRDRITLGGKPGHLHLQLERLWGKAGRASRLLLRGLHYAIVDEADSVLIDEARTPLIISRSQDQENERRAFEMALEMAEKLRVGRHFKVDQQERTVDLTGAGRGKLEELARSVGGIWARRQRREEIVLHALTAKHLFFRDKHYLVREGNVQIIDEYTGRTMPDRSWEHGLHQAIEAKEGCALTPQDLPVGRISYQRFFRRYLRLAGMTGTAREVASELGAVYNLTVVTVPTNRPLRRIAHPGQIYLTAREKWEAILERTESIHREGRPVLVGTRSVEASDHLSRLFMQADLPHHVLNARQDQEEAEIIARAGDRGNITVATNMAGRGTDIRLAPGVAELGGLHVIATGLHEARRIDRQLYGRCGRQGDPGSFEAILSLEDELIDLHGGWLKGLVARKRVPGKPVAPWIGRVLFGHAQRSAGKRHGQMRRDVLRMEIYMERTLAFTGISE